MAHEIVISSDETDFKTMLFKLMGRGLSTSIKKYGSFTIRYDDIKDLIYRIQQRVNNQNDCSISDFYAEFNFSDGSTDRVPSLATFENYRSTNRNLCFKAKIKMAFIVNFNNRGSEKQTIDITYESLDKNFKFLQDFPKNDNNLISGYSEISIEYTDITWANDIKNLFLEYISVHLLEYKFRSKLNKILSEKNIMSYGTPIILLLFMILSAILRKTPDYSAIIDNINSSSTSILNRIDKKLDSLILKENFESATSASSSIITAAVLILSIFAIVLMTKYFINNVPKSGFILSKEAEKWNDIELKRVNRGSVLAIVGILVSIGCSFASPYLEYILK